MVFDDEDYTDDEEYRCLKISNTQRLIKVVVELQLQTFHTQLKN